MRVRTLRALRPLGTLACLLLAGSADAASPADEMLAAGLAAAPAARPAPGAYCTPLGCGGGPSAPLGRAAGFGAAAGVVVWLGRHGRRRSR